MSPPFSWSYSSPIPSYPFHSSISIPIFSLILLLFLFFIFRSVPLFSSHFQFFSFPSVYILLSVHLRFPLLFFTSLFSIRLSLRIVSPLPHFLTFPIILQPLLPLSLRILPLLPLPLFWILNWECENFIASHFKFSFLNKGNIHFSTARMLFHTFVAIAYFTPILGSILADSYFGRSSYYFELAQIFTIC